MIRPSNLKFLLQLPFASQREREETALVLAYVWGVAALVYTLEFTGQPFVPVFWYFFIPAIGWVTFRSGLLPGLALAGLCFLLVGPIVVAEFLESGFSFETIAKLSTVILFGFAAVVSSYLVGLQQALEAKVAQVTEEREKTRRVIEAINDLVITTDSECQLLSANQTLQRMGTSEEGNSRTVCSALSPSGEDGEEICPHLCPIRDCVEGRDSVSRAVRITPADGSGTGIPVTWHSAPLFGDSSNVTGVVSVLRDMSRDEELGRSKREFIALVSHELRSPLTNMGAALELIESGRASESRRGDMLGTVRSELSRLARFVDEILDAESIERGSIPVDKGPTSVLPLVRTVVDAFAAEAGARRFTIDAPHLPFVLADSSMTERVLHNLIRNAVNYSAPGSPIRLELRSHEDFVWLSVIDAGFGIPTDRLETIFDRFSRAHMKDSQSIYGYGLGLYTCKMLVEAQGGRIWVESEEGRGSRFTLTLPVLPAFEEAL